MSHFGISEVELQKIVDKHVVSEGNRVSLGNLREAFKLVIAENNEAIKNDIQQMIDDAIQHR